MNEKSAPGSMRGSGDRPGGLHRQRKSKRRALADFARYADGAAVQFNEFAGQREPQASPFRFLRVVGADLAEFLEYRCAVVGSDADSRIGDADFDHVVDGQGGNADASAFWRKFYGVR